METKLIPKPRQIGMCMKMYAQEQLKRFLSNSSNEAIFNEPQTDIFKMCAIAKNNLKPAHEREIMGHMSNAEVSEIFSARLMKFLQDHFDSYKKQ